MAKNAAKKAPTKTEVYAAISEATSLSKKDVSAVFDALTGEIGKALGKKGSGVFQIPGLVKIIVKHIPATKERPGRNPATGETIMIKAKPARTSVKVRALKNLKAMV